MIYIVSEKKIYIRVIVSMSPSLIQQSDKALVIKCF